MTCFDNIPVDFEAVNNLVAIIEYAADIGGNIYDRSVCCQLYAIQMNERSWIRRDQRIVVLTCVGPKHAGISESICTQTDKQAE